MIDLHLHTTASDGRCHPREIVPVAARAQLSVISVTDHDTVAALDEVAAACAVEGMGFVTGIEITAVQDDEDVHVLGYFFDHRHPDLSAFLAEQRGNRLRRFHEMIERLRDLGLPLEGDRLIAERESPEDGSIGRPLLARAMVKAGFVKNSREAFDEYLADHRPAWVARQAPSPAAVVSLIRRAGGVSSIAHPALLGHDEWIFGMAEAGLDAIEAYYSDHSPEMTAHYRELAARLSLAVTGGSDYHGDPSHGPERPGQCVLPADAFEELGRRARQRRPV